MPTLTIYPLQFSGALHRGADAVNPAESAPTLPAGTVFAALVQAWRHLGGDVDAWCAPFVGPSADPPFQLSEALPYAGAVRFFPTPVGIGRHFQHSTLQERGKALKDIRFISEGMLRLVLAGRLLDDYLFPAGELPGSGPGLSLQGGAFWLTAEEQAHLPEELRRLPAYALRRRHVLHETVAPRVTIDRIASTSTLFHAGRVRFQPGCGLWLGVHWRRPDARLGDSPWPAAFERALRWLQEAGLGGMRTSGHGTFQLGEPDTMALPDPLPGGLAYLLCRYHPRADELQGGALAGEGTAYRLANVGGYLQSLDAAPQPRRRLTLVEAGSSVRLPVAPAGDLVDVRPDHGAFPHPVYQYGFALAAALSEHADG